MRRWELSVGLDASRDQPLFLQLASAVADEIRSGRLKPGDPLPGSRELAGHLGVNRNTVVAGYGELAAEGLVNTRVGGGTFVSAPLARLGASWLPWRSPPICRRIRSHARCSRHDPRGNGARHVDACDEHGRCTAVSRTGARARISPRDQPAQSCVIGLRRAMRPHPPAPRTCRDVVTFTRPGGDAGQPDGYAQYRTGDRSGCADIAGPGDVVVVEAFGYPPAWNVLKLAGAHLVPLPLDDDGLDIGALEQLLSQLTVRAVFLTPHHQYPTTSVMSPRRRVRLAELALRHRFAIIEDDYDHEFHYAGKPVLPIAAGAGRANTIYVGSLANLLAPGISTGFVTAPAPVFERLRALREASDARSDVAMECAIAELFEDGELLRHMRRMRRTYATRRDVLATALKHHLGSALTFRVPDGGMALWARADESIDMAGWQRAGEREGVLFHSARRFDFLQREQPFMRLGFSYLDESELAEAVRRMARALTRARTSQIGAAAREAPAAPGPAPLEHDRRPADLRRSAR